jgi:type I restriction enzyme M protein
MDQATHNKIVSFIWGIADDVLRDLFRRGKYPDVILPMCVLRRLDAVLEPTKKAVLETRKMLDDAGITEQTAALCSSAGQAFYNTSKFTLRDLKSRGNQQQLLADFEDYLNAFSPNVQDILETSNSATSCRHYRSQIPSAPSSPSSSIPRSTSLRSASTTTQRALSSRSWSASSTRTTTRRPASTGRRAMPCA